MILHGNFSESVVTALDSIRSHYTPTTAFQVFYGNILCYGLILCGGLLFSAHLRLKIPIGEPLGEGYVALPPILWVFFGASAFFAACIRARLGDRVRKSNDFLATLAGTFLLTVCITVFIPDVSHLQAAYFSFGSTIIAAITLLITPSRQSLRTSLLILWHNRGLMTLWVRYNVASRYSQTTLGILWIMALPVATAFIFTFVFSYIMKSAEIGNVPFISFFLTGLMFWSLFSQGILNGSVSIVGNVNLISQIYFPREILVIVKLGEALVDLLFVFVVTLFINLLAGIPPNIHYVFLPLLLAIQLTLMLGIMFFTSYLTVIVRDLQPLISVFMQMFFYLTPLMYPADILPPTLAEVVKFFNPVAALIEAYRNIMVYNRPPDFAGLYFSIVLSGVLLYSGYMFFKASERKLADFR